MIHPHEFWWRFFPKKELTQVYASTAIRNFAISIMGIFIPLYLYLDRGYSLQDTLIFFIFYSVVFAVASPMAAKFSSRYGIKHSVALSVPFYLAFIALMYALPYYPVPLILISSLLGLSQAFYWMGMHLVFHNVSDHKHRGEEVGKRGGIGVLAAMPGPFIGGVLISFIGFKVVFVAVSALLVFSALILFKSSEKHVPYRFSMRSVVKANDWKNSLFFTSRGTRAIAEGVIWPLFIFFILGSYLSLGIAGSLLSAITAVLLWVIGRYSDHSNKRKIARFATIFESIAWMLRAFVATVAHVYLVTILAAVTRGFRESPLGALEYDKAKGEVVAYFVSREIFICLGRILMLTLVLMINSLSGGMIFQGAASLAAFLF